MTSPDPQNRAISIVVPSRDRALSLHRTLDSLERLQVPSGRVLEIVVVLDGCTDDSARSLARRPASVHELRVIETQGLGPSAARNAGLALASGRLVAFVDDDVVPVPHWLIAHLACHAAGDTSIVSIGPMRLPTDVRLPPWNEWEVRSLQWLYSALGDGTVNPGPSHLFTANALVDRSLLDAAGSFDEGLRRAEDVELGFRLESAGAVFVYSHEASVLHYPVRSLTSWRAIPIAYGAAHVAMGATADDRAGRRPGIDTLDSMHPATRWVVRMFSGSRPVASAYCAAASVAGKVLDAVGLRRVSVAAFGSVYNVLYFESLSRALGGRAAFDAARFQDNA